MASATALTATPTHENTSPNLQTRPGTHTAGPRRGRGRGSDFADSEPQRAFRGRGRGQRASDGTGRGQRQQRQAPAQADQPFVPTPPPPNPNRRSLSSAHPIGDAEIKDRVVDGKTPDDQSQDVEAEVCFICASPVIHNSIAPCNHRTCHICALRLRALYKTRACAHCRTEAKFIIFTDDATKRYEDFIDSDFQQIDEVLGIKYEQKEIYDDTVLLLRYNCPAPDCDVACWGWPDLHRHVKGVHHKVLCDLCTRNKKVFTHEHELFTQQELRKHEKFGDDNPGAVDQSGFKGHPQCGFCIQRFYSDDELYTHCREKHERCHICDRHNQGRQQQYYLDYNALEEHFRKDHFLCPDQECLEKKFVVFESEMDLKVHQLVDHLNGLSKDVRRDARRVDISGFDYRSPHQDAHSGRRDREGRGRGRGRDPNAEALPMSTAQPMRRDEIAYQRQVALQGVQSSAGRGSLQAPPSGDAFAARPTGRNQETMTAPRQPGSTSTVTAAIESLHIQSGSENQSLSAVSANLTPQEQARQLQHAAVMDRASAMMQNDSSKITDFRSSVSSYRTSKITAEQMIETLFTLLDVPSSELGKLIKELAELYENDAKRTGLLKAWNDWRAINEDYPVLPGPGGVLPGSSAAEAGTGGKRVLRLKSSTAQSSRSAVSKQGSWGKGLVMPSSSNSRAGIAASSASSFPSLPASSSRSAATSTTPWASATPSSSRASPALTPSAPAATSTFRKNAAASSSAADAFPALPAAAKPNTMMMGLTKGAVRWDTGRSGNGNTSTAVNPWAGSPAPSSSSAAIAVDGFTVPPDREDDASTGGGGGGGKKKGNKNKKQTLYHFG